MKLLPVIVVLFLASLHGEVLGQIACSSNDGCQENEFCSEGSCREFGTCATLSDCRNPSNLFPVVACVGVMSCFDNGQCGIECGGSFCPPDEEEVECSLDPCVANTCNEPYETCVSSNCGGCNAHFFDAAGNEVCNDSTGVGISCSSNDGCEENEYCSEGLCREFGTCGQVNDCRNPANVYASVFCIGALSCFEGGRCGIECGEPVCPPGEEEAECPYNPCEVDNCDEPYESCVMSTCLGCNSHFFDAAGNEVCTDSTDVGNSCSSNDGCEENEYCSEGLCREFGTCGQVNDCRNPANVYPSVFCIGALSCSEGGQCGIECGEPVCAPDEEEFECFHNACEVDVCDEPYESCVMSTCGGCNSHFFDAAGNEVCTGSTDTEHFCSSNDDCKGSEYCSEGLCREFGTCGQVNDCRNPANVYPAVMCLGALNCFEGGQCGIECGEPVCPPGEEEFDCSYNPCEVDACNEPYESCVMSTCGGCNSHFFDAAGNEVCTGSADLEGFCSSDDDCQESEFCSEGSCREMGTCGQLNDCRNPSNLYQLPRCIGPLSCFDDGRCGIECGEPVCPPNEEEFECPHNACEENTCNEPYESCVMSTCGGCNSHFFDAAGNEVCTGSIDLESSCSSDDDCQESEFCSEGSCRQMGTCGQVNDCRNPSNLYQLPRCIGPLSCFDDGRCGIECGEPVCPENEENVECPLNACEENTCNEPYESCVMSTCGGCNSHFFDAAGNEVCANLQIEPLGDIPDGETAQANAGSSDEVADESSEQPADGGNTASQDAENPPESISDLVGSSGGSNYYRNPSNMYLVASTAGLVLAPFGILF